MAVLKYITPLLSLFLLTGCYDDFNPEIDSKPVLCLNSLITAGEPIRVEVTHTWRFNDQQSERDHDVPDARVTVLANGLTVGPDYLPQEGDLIRIVAESHVYGTATAETTVPYATPIGKVKVSPAVTNIWTGDGDSLDYGGMADVTFTLNIEMDISDPAGRDNYYHFGYNWFSPSADDNSDDGTPGYDMPALSIGKFEYDAEPLFKEHIGVFETIMGNAEDTEFVLFSDRQFSGRTYTLHLNFSNNVFRLQSSDYDDSRFDCGMNLYLTTVSQSYYNWAVYKWNVDEGIIGDLSDIGLAESKWGYSNVSTGAGVVAARSFVKYTIDLKEFLKSTIN